MEPRIMLAADAGVAVASTPVAETAPMSDSALEGQFNHTDNLAQHVASTLVIIDPSVASDFDFSAAVPDGADVVVLNRSEDAVAQISNLLSTRSNLESLHLISHGQSGQLQLGNDRIDSEWIASRSTELSRWSDSFAAGGDLLIYGCDVAAGSKGKAFLHQIASLTGLDVAASVDRTGASDQMGDWDLEVAVGSVEHDCRLDRSVLSKFSGALSIEIYAAGEVGDEVMQLQIGNDVVETWTMTGTDAGAGLFGRFDVALDDVSIEDIRINFTNDLNDPANGIDRSLRVDRIVVDGVTYQTEDPSVYSTGSGSVGGFNQSEYLRTDGYFQFAASDTAADPSASAVTNAAASATGPETVVSLASFTSAENLQLNGSATVSNGNLQLTSAVAQQRGSAYYTTPISVNADTSFQASFAARFDGGQGSAGGEGLAFIIQNSPGGTAGQDIGNYPGGLAYNAQQNTIGIELDTYKNSYEQFADEITITVNGVMVTPNRTIQSPYDLNNGQTYYTWVDYDGQSDTLSVYISDTNVKPGSALITSTLKLDQIVGNQAYVGFSAATGKAFNNTYIQSWNMVVDSPEVNDPPVDPPIDPPIDPPPGNSDPGLPDYASFTSGSNLQLNGSAKVNNGNLQLTSAVAQQRGSAYYTTPISVNADTSFQASFAARFDGGQGSAGGEGLAFIIQNSPGGTAGQDIGNYPGGLAYNAQQNTIGIELDTYKNSYEQFADEITITVNGVMVTPNRTIQSPYDLNNGQTYYTWVDYDGQSDTLSVYISDTNVKPGSALITSTLKLDQIVGNQAYVGFSAATGKAFNNTYIQSWNMALDSPSDNEPPVDPPPGNGESGSFVLASDFASVFENDTSVTLSIDRIGGSFGTASVHYATASETASEGSDFIANSGTLVFADGETRKSVTISILEDGIVEGTESFSFRLIGSENASLLAPRSATINILDIDQGLPVYSSFTSASNLQLNGSARVSNGNLQLTSAVAQQRGSAYYTTPINVNADTSFQASFAARFDGGQGSAGGEGLAFIIQNSPAGTAGQDLGNYPGGLAYNAQQNTIGIELDTFKNSYEQFADEITITVNGVMVTPVRTIQSPYDLNNGQVYYTWVDYNGQSDTLAVYISDTNLKPDFALMKTKLQLDAIVGNQAYVGFSAATGTSFNNTYIQSWSVTLDTPAADPPIIPTGEIIKQDLITGLNQPLNIEWSPDGRNMYIGEKAGIIRVSRDGGPLTVLTDISAITNNVQDRGLVDFEVHPDFFNNPYVYLFYTVDPPEVYNYVGDPLAGPDGSGNRAGRLIRMTLDASTNYTTIVPGSEITLLGANSTWNNFNAFVDSTLNFSEPPAGLNPDGTYIQDFINSDSRSHTVGGLAFGNDGALYVSIGDGASFNQTDPRAIRVQDPNSLSGKVLRIDPNTGQGFADNPFYDGNLNSNRSKVYQLGLRNPWRLSVDPTSGRLYIGETGLVSFEEINTGPPGTNFGWPFYEGGQGVNLRTPSYQGLPQAQAFYNSGQPASPALIAQPHTNGTDVIVLGSVGSNMVYGPQYDNDVFYLDFASGVVRHADVNAAGNLTGVGVFATGANFVVDIQQGPDGFLYYVDIVSGTIGRFVMI